MLIRILAGTYGHRPDPDKCFIEKKDKNSPPFEVSDKEAARLTDLGIAQEVFSNIELESDKSFSCANLDGQKEELEQLSIQKLRKMAKDLGLPADGSKAVLADKIRNASVKDQEKQDEGDSQADENEEADVYDGEAPPILQAAEPEV